MEDKIINQIGVILSGGVPTISALMPKSAVDQAKTFKCVCYDRTLLKKCVKTTLATYKHYHLPKEDKKLLAKYKRRLVKISSSAKGDSFNTDVVSFNDGYRPNTVEQKAIERAQLRSDIAEIENIETDLYVKALNTCLCAPTRLFRDILVQLYVERKTTAQIAVKMNYSVSTIAIYAMKAVNSVVDTIIKVNNE